MKSIFRPVYYFLPIAFAMSFLFSCKHDQDDVVDPPPANSGIDANTNVMGYGILSHLPGIWNGPVSSNTALGSYPEWIVDFRPVSAAQVSSKAELDSLNNILMSFFIVKHGSEYKMAFRNGGGFAGNQRISYAMIDSVSETATSQYYRFVDFKAGKNRTYTEVLFKDDSLIMHAHTNVYNTLQLPQTHMFWQAKLQDTSSAQSAISHFSFPQKQMVRDFTGTFDSQLEAIYYNLVGDPYPESAQPYLGSTTVNVSFSSAYTPDPNKQVFLMITTQPLFSGFTFLPSQLKYRSRYVFLSSTDNSYTFASMHPGSYYLYTLYDNNNDGTFSSGDWMSSNLSNTFSLSESGNSAVNTQIDFTIP